MSGFDNSGLSDLGAFGKPLPNVPQDVSVRPEPMPPRVDVAPPSAVQPPVRYEIGEPSDIGGYPDICFKRKTTMFLYDAFTELVRKLYRDCGTYLKGTPNVKWGLTPQKDGLWIDTEFNWKPEHPDFVPAIYVKLGGITYSSVVNNPNAPMFHDVENGSQEFERTADGTVTFVHVSGTSGEAVSLCDNTRFKLNEFGAQIADDLCMTRFHEQQVSGLAPAQKKSRERWQCATTFAFQYNESWVVKKESPILRSVDLLQERAGYGKIDLERDFPTPTARRWSETST